jgi:bifunctional DNA-binding transcriptional regulator/antitoxin component of YhaV-PrlF toxin-antitoxin module
VHIGEYVVTVTSIGRLTLPAAVRRRSGIELGDRVVIVIEVQASFPLRRLEHDVHSVRGLIAAPAESESGDFDDLIEEAMADHADEMLRRLRGKSGDLVETGSGCDLLRVRRVCQGAASIVDAVQ